MVGASATYSEYTENKYFKTELPSHWLAKNLSYLARSDSSAFVDGPFGSDLKSAEYLESGVPLIQLNNIRDGHHILRNMKFISSRKKTELSRHVAFPNDIVFAKMAEPVARCTMVCDAFSEYVIVADCVKMSPNLDLVCPYFLVWAINSDAVRINAELVSSGTTRIRINLGELKKLKVPFPPLAEQTKIAAFLDYETAKIDALIAKQQRLIALLEEKRQAVISHAVTKGLDPTAPLRPSGIDWLGDVPAHWEVCRLKHVKGKHPNSFVDGPFGSNLKSEHFSPQGEVFVIESNFATTGKIRASELKKISKRHFETIKRSAAKGGDIIIAKIGARYGMSSILPELDGDAVVSGNSLKLTIDSELVLNAFALELLRHLKVQEAMDENVNVTAQPALSLGGLNNLPFLKVPLKEQRAIVAYLKTQVDVFEKLLSKAQSAITLLKERRTALISAAVTGKIDLRGWQAPAEAEGNIQDERALA